MNAIARIQRFIDVESNNYDGFRPKSLPGWSKSMCYPICFDAELAKEEFESGISEDEIPEEYIAIGRFYEANSTEQLNDIWAFILVKNKQDDEEVILWSDEGPASLEMKLDKFLTTLIPPSSPKWKMK